MKNGIMVWPSQAIGGIIIGAILFGWKVALLIAVSSWHWGDRKPAPTKGEGK